ncbi:hypothetical protein [Fulvivirga ligni]|uniref:hypothetical protein n=1 Tax=Fulvivirga ligni TaxID=2904246 RepID=UPI001F349F3B|nr:hypothetical protein [Fulvivirga ligni]UII23210.1 hypothetical protein LVD16_08215 [Fulvivirga ligni]
MQIIHLDHTGKIPSRYQYLTGAPFSLLHKIKLKGVGSPFFIYQNGITEFDVLGESNADINYVNIELFSLALVVRFKKKNDFLAAIINPDDITEITFNTFRLKYRSGGREVIKKAANITICQAQYDNLELFLSVSNYAGGYSFFKKRYFSGKVKFELDPRPPLVEDDIESLLLKLLFTGLRGY